ncbi:hypothetical protein CBR_g61469 [Chara braunii]|uniref:Carbohydrate kinase PfkB domain-containing protein n=1 Tax=Chara braunii TaxID=69332 RepID=A0A388K8P9_CHABU|nr:hypothetical protein CBR_g61469 [Chara braunii]|eukprot:GBG66425.1 hypothetical protein CBR_g61469 [Chara braunii]
MSSMAIPGEVIGSNPAAMAASSVRFTRGNHWCAGDLQRSYRPRALHADVALKVVSQRHVGIQRDRLAVKSTRVAMASFEGLRQIDISAIRLRSCPPSNAATFHAIKSSNGHRYTSSLGPLPAAAEREATGAVAAVEPSPVVVVGSVNADIYVEIQRLPLVGETIAARSGTILPGGKGANQAACAAKLGYPTYLVAQVGQDLNANLVRDTLREYDVRMDHVSMVLGPTGCAVVMLQPKGKNSIIIVGGANATWPRLGGGSSRLKPLAQALIKRAGALVLQREIPDAVNLEAARKGAQVLVKRGSDGALLIKPDGDYLNQPAITAPTVVDTTGAGDTFTAAFTVATLQGMKSSDALQFAAAAACICVQRKGAMISMPTQKEVADLLDDQKRKGLIPRNQELKRKAVGQ